MINIDIARLIPIKYRIINIHFAKNLFYRTSNFNIWCVLIKLYILQSMKQNSCSDNLFCIHIVKVCVCVWGGGGGGGVTGMEVDLL